LFHLGVDMGTKEDCINYDEVTDGCYCKKCWEIMGKPAGFGCPVKPYWKICQFYEVEGQRFLGMSKEALLALVVLVVVSVVSYLFGRLGV